MINILLAILVLSIIVIVHEFGHFIVAKANGVTVLEFCLGFGPKLIHFKKGDTDYSIKLLPFGGACIMLGDDFLENEKNEEDENDLEDAEEDSKRFSFAKKIQGLSNESSEPESETNKNTKKDLTKQYDMSKSFENQSVWARIAIIAAGPLFNFIFAFILSIIIIGKLGYDPCIVNKVYEDSPAAAAGLMEGDRIVKVNSDNITFDREFSFYRSYHATETLNITYERNGERYTTDVTPVYQTSNAYRMGITITNTNTIESVNIDSPADKGGLKVNDIIQTVNGETLQEGKITKYINETKGETLTLGVLRNGKNITLNVKPEIVETAAYYTGFDCYGLRYEATPMQTIKYAFDEVGFWIETVVKSIGMMFTGKVSVNDLSGPVGTVSVMSSVVEQSKSGGSLLVILNLINLGIIISANLGMMNLLPLPALDGGRLVFLVIEAIRGKPIKKEREGMVHFVGMVLLMLLMIYVLFKDIIGLF